MTSWFIARDIDLRIVIRRRLLVCFVSTLVPATIYPKVSIDFPSQCLSKQTLPCASLFSLHPSRWCTSHRPPYSFVCQRIVSSLLAMLQIHIIFDIKHSSRIVPATTIFYRHAQIFSSKNERNQKPLPKESSLSTRYHGNSPPAPHLLQTTGRSLE